MKKIAALGIALSVLLLGLGTISVYAKDDKVLATEFVEDVSIDYEELNDNLCSACGNGKIQVVGTYETPEFATGANPPCIHYPHGTDKVWKHDIITTYRCNNCGYGYNDIKAKTRLECFGYY